MKVYLVQKSWGSSQKRMMNAVRYIITAKMGYPTNRLALERQFLILSKWSAAMLKKLAAIRPLPPRALNVLVKAFIRRAKTAVRAIIIVKVQDFRRTFRSVLAPQCMILSTTFAQISEMPAAIQ